MKRFKTIAALLVLALVCACRNGANENRFYHLMLANSKDGYSVAVWLNGEPMSWVNGFGFVTFRGYPIQQTNLLAVDFEPHTPGSNVNYRVEFSQVDDWGQPIDSVAVEDVIGANAAAAWQYEFTIWDLNKFNDKESGKGASIDWDESSREQAGRMALNMMRSWSEGEFTAHGEPDDAGIEQAYRKWKRDAGRKVDLVEDLADLDFLVGDTVVLIIPGSEYRRTKYPALLRFGSTEHDESLEVGFLRLLRIQGGNWALVDRNGEHHPLQSASGQ